MKIAIIGSRGYPYVYSGYETFVKELAERLVEKQVEVRVYCYKSLFSSYPQQINGIKLYYISGINSKSLSQLTHSFFSLIHATFSSVDAILVVNAANGPLGWIPKLRGKKTLINVDGLEWLRPKWKGFGGRYFYFAAKTATKLYDLIITDAEEMRKVYLKEFQADSIVIAYGAPNALPASESLLNKFNLEPNGYYLIVGRLIPDNNAELVIEGFLRSASLKKLVVVGDVPYRDDYADRLKNLKDWRLVFTGYVTDPKELMALYQHCFIYVHGHKYGGTNPTMLKAMANNCAILALNTVFNKEMLQNKYGVFFEENTAAVQEKIRFLEHHPHVVLKLKTEVSKGLINKYNWDFITNAYLAALKNLTEPKKTRRI